MTTVGIIGLGYVGLPLAVAFAEEGCEVVAVDVDPRKTRQLQAGQSYIEDIPSERLQAVLGRLTVTTGYEALAGVDAVLVCVPTPLSVNREPDLGPLVDSMRALSNVLRQANWWYSSRPPTPAPHASGSRPYSRSRA